ncbi:predicted protein [Histoplasma capsulatum var. duboisii H88]|uniref:Predicted protein n=1 Tax=Ajellomyces capsulatus (strain H88) TaxID=544711 RepID=F0UGJ3_AJEC8|nr:predicted protein [Histoplasma capsulatum var. duboisii H88]QSS55906.1 hypothetical protein I7I53_03915 [Histoplasma capsulatum var. duboisii H88]
MPSQTPSFHNTQQPADSATAIHETKQCSREAQKNPTKPPEDLDHKLSCFARDTPGLTFHEHSPWRGLELPPKALQATERPKFGISLGKPDHRPPSLRSAAHTDSHANNCVLAKRARASRFFIRIFSASELGQAFPIWKG